MKDVKSKKILSKLMAWIMALAMAFGAKPMMALAQEQAMPNDIGTIIAFESAEVSDNEISGEHQEDIGDDSAGEYMLPEGEVPLAEVASYDPMAGALIAIVLGLLTAIPLVGLAVKRRWNR